MKLFSKKNNNKFVIEVIGNAGIGKTFFINSVMKKDLENFNEIKIRSKSDITLKKKLTNLLLSVYYGLFLFRIKNQKVKRVKQFYYLLNFSNIMRKDAFYIIDEGIVHTIMGIYSKENRVKDISLIYDVFKKINYKPDLIIRLSGDPKLIQRNRLTRGRIKEKTSKLEDIRKLIYDSDSYYKNIIVPYAEENNIHLIDVYISEDSDYNKLTEIEDYIISLS